MTPTARRLPIPGERGALKVKGTASKINTLGELAIIVVFGAVIGKLMVDSGAAHQIAHTLLARLGLRYVQLSVIIIGLIFGLAMFYEVAFIMLH